MRSSSWVLTSLAFASASPALAQQTLRVEIEYEVSRNGSKMAEVTDRLELANGTYQLTEHWKGRGVYSLLGRARRTSQGSFDANGPRPHEYVDERSGRDTQRVWFDWKANTITRRYKGEARTEPVPPDTQDRLSFVLALGVVSKKGEPVSFHVADGRGMSRHEYRPNGRERIGTPAGVFDTVKYVRKNGAGDMAEVYLATERSYLPVRTVVVEKDGTRYEHVATRISQ